jgi:hypothetical protein
MWGSILGIIAPIVVRTLAVIGFKEEQIKKFLDWIHGVQKRSAEGSQMADEEAAAKKKLEEQIKQEPTAK